jgi:hypothetical protein
MARGKRSPIDYKPQFGGGIFRPMEEVEEDLAQLEQQPESASSDMSASQEPEKAEPPPERVRVRHSFDVYRDQLFSLTAIQIALFSKTGKKPKLGDLVQEALDAYISSHCDRTDERSNVRPNER